MRLCTANASGALETVCKGTAQVGGENLAVGELYKSPAIVAVTVLGEFAIDSLLSYGYDAVDLLLGVGETGVDVEVVSADINLCVTVSNYSKQEN